MFRRLTLAALLGALLSACATVPASSPPSAEGMKGDTAFDTSYDVTAPVAAELTPGQTHTFGSGSTVRVDVEHFAYPTQQYGVRTPRETLERRYVLLRVTYTNATGDPRGMDGMLAAVSTPSGNGYEWTLGVDVDMPGGPVRPGKTGTAEWVYAVPQSESDATELYATIYEPWPQGTALYEQMPESVELHVAELP